MGAEGDFPGGKAAGAPVLLFKKLLSKFSNNSFSQFSFDLWEAFLAADIPLWKLTSPTLRNLETSQRSVHSAKGRSWIP
jgi:hypothetical protein